MDRKPTVVFDFDGVIHSYTSGWKGHTVMPDPPVEGIKEAIDELSKDYKIVVVSTRCEYGEGLEAVWAYLDRHNITVDDVSATKPPAIAYIDDRAICFDGNSKALPGIVRGFKTWQNK